VNDAVTQAFSRRVEAGVAEQLRRLQPRREHFSFVRVVEHRVHGYVLAPLLPLVAVAEYQAVPELPVPSVWLRPSGEALLEALAGGDPEVCALASDAEVFGALLDVVRRRFVGDLQAARRLGEQVMVALGARRGVRLHPGSLPNIDNAALDAHLAELDARLKAASTPAAKVDPAPAPSKRRRTSRAQAAADEAAAEQLDSQLALSSAFSTTQPDSRPSRR
jgi:hypothetical protein